MPQCGNTTAGCKMACGGLSFAYPLYQIMEVITMKKLRTNEAAWNELQGRWCIRVQSDGVRKAFYSSKPGKKGKIEAERKADEWLERGEIKEMRFGVAYDQNIRRRGTGPAHAGP